MDERTGATLHEAHTLAAWATHARRTGDLDHASTLEHAARRIAEPQGMMRVLSTLAPPVTDVRSRTVYLDGVTDRENEVLQLLEEGLSNRAIARRLTISENTAANHVRSILMKTGCANRTEAALLAQRRRSGG